MTLTEVNTLPETAFIATLGSIYEDSSWVAKTIYTNRPFSSLEQLHNTMQHTVQISSNSQQLELIRKHPDLGTKLGMSQHSVTEQSSLGLNNLSPELFAEFSGLNQSYKTKFGFPFIIAVRDHNLKQILSEFKRRYNLEPEAEQQEAIRQISRIAWHRLNALLET